MKNLWKYSGTFLTATGIIHSIVGLVVGWEGHAAILRDGVVDALKEDFGRNLAFWFLVCGVVIILLGLTLQHYLKVTSRPAPKFTGWFLLIFAVVGCLIVPASGFWLFLPQAWIILAANRLRNNKEKK